jgi:hypothetical protein
MVREVTAVLDRPDHFAIELVRPTQCFEMALLSCGDFSLAEQLPGGGVDCRERVGALVHIRSDHDHPSTSLRSIGLG